MAFAVTAGSSGVISLGGGFKLAYGRWTGVVGDATGTITIAGGAVFGGQVWENSSGAWVTAPFSFTQSAGAITLTIENIAGVTDGRYWFLFR